MSRAAHTSEPTYRNANGVYMKLMNFRRFDPEFTSEGKVGLTRGSKQEGELWDEFSHDPAALATAVAAIRARVDTSESAPELETRSATQRSSDTPYWVFACNPKKWAIDRFLDRRIEHDSWGVRPSDRDRFAPGQLGIVRVGVDRRTIAERNGTPPPEPGIYALCEVESGAFASTGASDEFWAPGEAREKGWPSVKLRYVKTYLGPPLTIERLRTEAPDISHLLLDGFQAASFPISAEDFNKVISLLGDDLMELATSVDRADSSGDQLADLERRYLRASPEAKERLGRHFERGPIGALVKKRTGFRCQLCEALGRNPIGFLKKNGEPYVEAHHVMPVSTNEVGTLSASNVMTLCANHHRQMHSGCIDVTIATDAFEFVIDDQRVSIPRLAVAPVSALAAEIVLV